MILFVSLEYTEAATTSSMPATVVPNERPLDHRSIIGKYTSIIVGHAKVKQKPNK